MPNALKRKNLLSLCLLAIGALFIVGRIVSYVAQGGLPQFGTVIQRPANFDFASYDKLLQQHVASGRVDYAALKNSAQLKDCVAELSRISPEKFSPNEQLAFWINAYNLLTLNNICSVFPVASINQIPSGTSRHRYRIGGEAYSTADIDHDHIRPLAKQCNWQAVFLVNNGSTGYPQLLSEAVHANTMNDVAQKQMLDFISSSLNYRIDRNKHVFAISQFYSWNQEVLSIKDENPFSLVNKYLPDSVKIGADEQAQFRYEYLPDFDYSLNSQSSQAQPE